MRIESETGEGFLCLVDTGFNGELFMEATQTKLFGFKLFEHYENVVLGDGHLASAQLGRGTINWIGGPRQIELMATSRASQERPSLRDDDPAALIGTRLLAPHSLLIDFAARTVALKLSEAAT